MIDILNSKIKMYLLISLTIAYIAFWAQSAPSLAVSPNSDEPDLVAVAMGSNHALALTSNGTVWAWGSNHLGECGINYNKSIPILAPVQVPGLFGVRAIAVGDDFSIALKDDGTVYTWGSNSYGQLGLGINSIETEASAHSQPTHVPGLYNITSISAGGQCAMALRDDGTVFAWGYNGMGQIPDGKSITMDSYDPSPVKALGLDNVKAICVGPSNAIAIKNDGTLWTWGHRSDIWGEMMNKSMDSVTSTPFLLTGISNVTMAVLGDGHAAVLNDDGTVWTWGSDWRGLLGIGSEDYHKLSSDYSLKPVQVPGLTNVTSISAGIEDTVVIKADGTVWSWGGNEYGQLGDGTREDRNTPIQVPISNAVYVSAGGQSTAIIDKDGHLWAFGADVNGELGDGTWGDDLCRLSPIRVSFSLNDTSTSYTATQVINNSTSPTPESPGLGGTLLTPVLILIAVALCCAFRRK